MSEESYKQKLLWFNIITLLYTHVSGIYGLYLAIFHAKWLTLLWTLCIHEMCVVGVTAGAHRLWAHRSYKAKLPLKLILIIFQTMAYQGSVIGWAHTHRIHHKFSDTDADPHNPQRGMFFAHIGWLFVEYHPAVLEKRKKTPITDLTSDPLLHFQKRFFLILMPILCFYMPAAVPVYFWGETWQAAFHVNMFRYIFCLHITFLINSLAHAYGNKPYDKSISPADSTLCSVLTNGEGWHNFHHVFPWDYKTGELGKYDINITTEFLNFMAKIGWAYDLKSVTPQVLNQRMRRTGEAPVWS